MLGVQGADQLVAAAVDFCLVLGLYLECVVVWSNAEVLLCAHLWYSHEGLIQLFR